MEAHGAGSAGGYSAVLVDSPFGMEADNAPYIPRVNRKAEPQQDRENPRMVRHTFRSKLRWANSSRLPEAQQKSVESGCGGTLRNGQRSEVGIHLGVMLTQSLADTFRKAFQSDEGGFW